MNKNYRVIIISVLSAMIINFLVINHQELDINSNAKTITTQKVKYHSVDAFPYKANRYATKNAKDNLKIPKGFLFSFDSQTKKIVQAQTYSNKFIRISREINRFHPKISDVKRIVNPTKLSTNQQREISQYTANLINNLRHHLSNNYQYVPDLVVTNRALAISKSIADGYSNDKWNIFRKHAHDIPVLNRVFAQYNYQMVGENFASSILKKRASMANIKESIYGAVSSMMFDDASSNWDHTMNFLGINFNSQLPIEFGVSIDSMTQLHFEFYQGN